MSPPFSHHEGEGAMDSMS